MFNGIPGIGGGFDIIAYVGLGGDTEFVNSLRGVDSAVNKTGQQIDSVMNKALIASTAVFGAAMTAAIQFESSFAGIIKTVDGLKDPLGQINEEGKALSLVFRGLAFEIPASVNELNMIGQAAGQLGIHKADLADFTKTIAALGVSSDMTFEAGAMAIARFINVTKNVAPAGLSMAAQAQRIGATIVDLGNNFAATENEISRMAQRIAGAGAIVGMSQADIMAYSAALAASGVAAEFGGSAISRVFIKINAAVADGGKKLQIFSKVAGMSAEDFQRAFVTNAADATQQFIAGLGDMSKAGYNVFGVLKDLELNEIRVRETLLKTSAASDMLSDALNRGRDAYEENIALTIEAAVRYGTFESQAKVLGNVIYDAFIDMGNSSKPFFAEWLKFFNENPEKTKSTVIFIGEMVLTVGALAAIYKTAMAAVKAYTVAQNIMNTTMGPVGLILTGIAAGYFAITNAMEAAEKNRIRAIDAISDEAQNIKKLEDQYNFLMSKEEKTAAQKERLSFVTGQLTDIFKEQGIAVEGLGEKQVKYADDIANNKLDKLTKDYEALAASIQVYDDKVANLNFVQKGDFDVLESLRNWWNGEDNIDEKRERLALLGKEIGQMTDYSKALAAAGIETDDSIREQVLSLIELRDKGTDPASRQYQVLNEKIKTLQNSLIPIDLVMEAHQERLDSLAKFGIKFTSSVYDEIESLSSMHDLVSGDAMALEQYRQKIFELHESVGDHSGWLKFAEGVTGHKAVFQKMTAEVVAGSDLYNVLGGAIGGVRVSLDKLNPAIIQTVKEMEVLSREDMFEKMGIESDRGLQSQISALTFYREELAKVGVQLTGNEALLWKEKMAELKIELNEGAWSLVNVGEGFAQLLNKMGGGYEVVGGLIDVLANSARTGFNPLATVVNVATWGLGLFADKGKEVEITMDDVKASIGTLGDQITKTDDLLKNLGDNLSSSLVDDLVARRDAMMQALQAAMQFSHIPGMDEWAEDLRDMLRDLESELENLTKAFQLDFDFTEQIEQIEYLTEKSSTLMSTFGNIDTTGLQQLLGEQIVSSARLLATLDPTSEAYENLEQKIWQAQAALAVMSGSVQTAEEYYQKYGIVIKEISDATDDLNEKTWDQFSLAEKLAEINVDTTDQLVEEKTRLQELLPSLEDDAYARQQIIDKIGDINEKLGIKNEIMEVEKTLEEQLADAGIVTTAQLLAEKLTLESLLPALEDDVYARQQIIEKIEDINDKLGIKNSIMLVEKTLEEQLAAAGIQTTEQLLSEKNMLENLLPALQEDVYARQQVVDKIRDINEKLGIKNEIIAEELTLEKKLADAGIVTTQQLLAEKNGLNALLPSLENDVFARQQIIDKISAIDEKLGLKNETMWEEMTLEEQFAALSIKTASSIEEERVKLIALIPRLKEGSYEWKQATDKLKSLNDELGIGTAKIDRYAITWEASFNDMFAVYDLWINRIKSGTEEAQKLFDFGIDLDTTNVDEQLQLLVLRSSEFLYTLSPDSESYKDAETGLF